MKFLILGDKSYSKPFTDLGEITYKTGDFSESDVLVFTGGEDVDPSVYKETCSTFTKSNIERDRAEHILFEYALAEKKPMIGICRGAQLGCALSGGSIIQHVTNHLNRCHPIITSDGRVIENLAGDHHQMMMPYDLPLEEYELFAWADGLSNKYLNGANAVHQGVYEYSRAKYPEPEGVYFTKSRFLAVQWHPEWMKKGTEGWLYFQELVANYIMRK